MPVARLRRPVLRRLLLAAALLPFAALPAAAQDYPARSITLVVPHPAGGTSDILARQVSAEVSKALKQTILVDNKGGGNGTVAARQVALAPPDGYTLLLATASTHGINPSLYPKAGYDAVKDFAPVLLLATVPNALVVGPAVKARNVAEFVAWLKAQGERANMGSAGAGTPGHLAGELFKDAAGVAFLHVPYKGGGPAITDLLGGRIDFMFTTLPAVLPHIRAGTLRALAVTSPKRSAALPEVPTLIEAGVDVQALSWHGIVAPAGTPAAVVERLARAFGAALAAPEVRQRLAAEGAEAAALAGADYGRFIAREVATWAKAVQGSGATAD